jgi:hypothetical protein
VVLTADGGDGGLSFTGLAGGAGGGGGGSDDAIPTAVHVSSSLDTTGVPSVTLYWRQP